MKSASSQLVILYTLFLLPLATGDQVVLKNGITLEGDIIKTNAVAVHLKAKGGNVLEINRATIRSIKIKTPKELTDANKRYRRGDFQNSIPSYLKGITMTRHPVLIADARQKLVVCYLQIKHPENALDNWLELLALNAESALESIEFFLVNDQAWAPTVAGPAMARLTEREEPEAAIALNILRALHALKQAKMEEATAAVGKLETSTTETERNCSQFLLGKIALSTGSASRYAKEFEAAAEELSPAARAYGSYWVGQSNLKAGKKKEALLAFLWVALLHPELSAVAGNAMYESGVLLEAEQPAKASNFYMRIIRDHLSSSRVADAKRRLAVLQ